MLKMETGSHLALPSISHHAVGTRPARTTRSPAVLTACARAQVRKFKFEPLTENTLLDVDGERMERGVRMRAHGARRLSAGPQTAELLTSLRAQPVEVTLLHGRASLLA